MRIVKWAVRTAAMGPLNLVILSINHGTRLSACRASSEWSMPVVVRVGSARRSDL